MGWSFWSRRFLPGLGGDIVNANWRYEAKELLYRRLIGNTREINELVIERDMRFDHDLSAKLSKKKFTTFWGFQGSCFDSLKKANELGVDTICEMTIAHLPYARRILEDEAVMHPEWADSIDFISFPVAYEKRLIEEPAIAKKVIAISSFLKNTLISEGIDEKKITVIPLGFDVNAVKYNPITEPVANRPLRLLYAGRITQRKGIKYLLEAMKAFNKKDVELHIIGNIYGSGNAFRSFSDTYSYTKGVTQAELFKIYSNYDALVFPSVLEGFGLVTVEAMGAGLPVITTPHTNATELITNGKNGFLIPIRNTQAIIESIEHLRNLNDDGFQQMRQHARETAMKYTWEAHKHCIAQFISSSN